MKPFFKVIIIATVIFFISMSIGLFFFEKDDHIDEKLDHSAHNIHTDLILPDFVEDPSTLP